MRLVAGFLDLVVLASCLLLFFASAVLELLLTSDFGEVDPPEAAVWGVIIIIAAYFLLFVPLYFVLLWTWRGQTIGQVAMHIRVVRRDRSRVKLPAAALRFLGYLLATATLFLGFLVALFDAEKRGLHDRLADTVVVELP